MSDRDIMEAKNYQMGSRDFERTDKYVQAVKEKFEERSQTGIRKYSTTLEREDLNFLDWLQHLQEELMDATLYVERLKTSYVEEIKRQGKGSLGE